MRIDHTESYEDFGEQFSVDSKIDGYFGSQEMLSDTVKPFDLRRLKGKVVMEAGEYSKTYLNTNPKNLLPLSLLLQLMLQRKTMQPQ